VGFGVVKSVGRTFEILELFDKLRRPMSAKEIADHFGYPASSGMAILKSLVILGYLSYDRTSRLYFPTPRLASIGNWVDQALFGHGHVIDLMNDLSEATGETISLCTHDSGVMRFIHVIDGRHPINATVVVGRTSPLTRSSVGRAYLATLDDRDVSHLVERLNKKAASKKDRTDMAELAKQLKRVRQTGYEASYGEVVEGLGAIAVALPTKRAESRFVLCLAGPSERLQAQEKALARRMRELTDQQFKAR
jgi:DNA-binding IclR family transcriptional regulator